MPCRTRVESFLHQRCFFIFGNEDTNKRKAASLRSCVRRSNESCFGGASRAVACLRNRVRSARKSSPVTSPTRSTVDLVGSSATNSAKASLTAANRNHETDWMLDVRAPYIPPKRPRRLHRSEVKRLTYQQLTRSVAPFQFWPKLSVR